MWVHLQKNIFGVGELLIIALRHSTTRSTYRLYRQDRIVSATETVSNQVGSQLLEVAS